MCKTVFFISAGLKEPKKEGNPLAKYHSYLNYGILGLASILDEAGYETQVFHGKFYDPVLFANSIFGNLTNTLEYPIFLSIPSVFAIDWCKDFINQVKILIPKAKIIAGGRWVVENDGNWIKEKIKNIDLVVYGTAERRIDKLLSESNWTHINYTDLSKFNIPEKRLDTYPSYNYLLMNDYFDFQPSIEVSRGCGLGCSFCLEKDEKLQNMKSPFDISNEIYKVQTVYNKKNVTPYFESSFFRPSLNWAEDFLNNYQNYQFQYKWRAETRIDSLSEKIIFTLAQAGLQILDIGLESASMQQLKIMNKSSKPETYLKRASAFLSACKAAGIWTKVNILLYAGENEQTIDETMSWLDLHRNYIKGVSVNPLIVYGHDNSTAQYLRELETFGAFPVENTILDKGYTRLHLSRAISYERAEEVRLKISQDFMDSNAYFDLKSFSYFPSSFTRENFNELCLGSNYKKLPFRLDV